MHRKGRQLIDRRLYPFPYLLTSSNPCENLSSRFIDTIVQFSTAVNGYLSNDAMSWLKYPSFLFNSRTPSRIVSKMSIGTLSCACCRMVKMATRLVNHEGTEKADALRNCHRNSERSSNAPNNLPNNKTCCYNDRYPYMIFLCVNLDVGVFHGMVWQKNLFFAVV